MRIALLGLAAALTLGAMAQAQTPAPAAAAATPAYSSASTVGTLLGNPAAKAVLMKFIPEVVTNPQIDQALEMQLTDLAQYVPALTPEMFAKIDAELAKVPKA